jgi:hypothetical protein
MKESLSNNHPVVAEKNLIQEKISLLCDNDFLWKEIAVLTGIPKKLVKGIAKGKYIPNKEECIRLGKKFDEVIAKVRIAA